MTRPAALGLVLAGALLSGALLAGCGDDDAELADAAGPTTTEVPDFEGDADSAFCRVSRESAGEPVLDPFAPELGPDEVRVRFESLAARFDRFTDVAPVPLEDDLVLLDRRFDRLGAVLADADWEFPNLVGSGEDLSVFDDPALADVAERLSAYQSQVCGL